MSKLLQRRGVIDTQGFCQPRICNTSALGHVRSGGDNRLPGPCRSFMDSTSTSGRVDQPHPRAASWCSTLVEFAMPRSWGSSSSWLTECMPAIVRQCRASKAPFLHLVSSRTKMRQRRLAVPAIISEQAWSSIQSEVTSSGADALVLVRPLRVPDEQHLSGCTGCARGCAAPSASNALSSISSLPPSSSFMPSMSGTVNAACCDGPRAEHPAAHHTHHHHEHHHEHHQVHQPQSPCGGATSGYFGLVVQSAADGSGSGSRRAGGATPAAAPSCYVLKTCSSEDASGCTCVHYSLTRVMPGQAVWGQVMGAWRA